jgi:hypothetical protein
MDNVPKSNQGKKDADAPLRLNEISKGDSSADSIKLRGESSKSRQMKLYSFELNLSYMQGDDLTEALSAIGKGRRMVVMSEIDPAEEAGTAPAKLDWEDASVDSLMKACSDDLDSALNRFKSAGNNKLVTIEDPALYAAYDTVSGLAEGVAADSEAGTIALKSVDYYSKRYVSERRSLRMLELASSAMEKEDKNSVFVIVAGSAHIVRISDAINASNIVRKGQVGGDIAGPELSIEKLPQRGIAQCVKKMIESLPKELDDAPIGRLISLLASDALNEPKYAQQRIEVYSGLKRALPVARLNSILDQVCNDLQELENGGKPQIRYAKHAKYLNRIAERIPDATSRTPKHLGELEVYMMAMDELMGVVAAVAKDERVMEMLFPLADTYPDFLKR